MILWYFWVLLVRIQALDLQDNQLVFKSAEYSVQNPNFTIGALFQLVKADGEPNVYGVSDALTLYCSLERYAHGDGKFPVKGTFNLFAVKENEAVDQQVNSLITRLEAQDLFYAVNGSQFGPVPDTPIGAIFLGARLNEIIYFNGPLAFFPIPLLANTEAGDIELTSSFEQDASSPEFGLQLATGPVALILAAAVNELALAFNWTLLGLMYSNDPYGSAGQAVSIDLEGFSAVIAIQCNQIYVNSTSISEFSSCISSSRKTRAIILWMPLNEASKVAQEIINDTGLQNELVFIIPFAGQDTINLFDFPVMTFYFTTLLYQNQDNFNAQCLNYARSNTAGTLLSKQALEKYYSHLYKCNLTKNSLPPCPESINERTYPCYCTGDEQTVSTYVANNVDLLMEAINQMQTNCSGLTQQAAEFFPNFPAPDFCALTTFNTKDLAYALKTIQLKGYEGATVAIRLSTDRNSVSLKLYQFQPNGTVAVGVFENFNLTIDTSAAFFYTNITSEIVPDNPSITNSALAAVGFSIDIALMILTVAVMIFVLWNSKHPIIRKSSPVFCMLILTGIFFIELSFLFYCMSLSDVICHLDDWFVVTGVALVIANLLAKSYRVYIIFHNRSARSVRISEWSLLVFSASILLITWIMMILYITLGDGLNAVVVQSSSDSFYTYVLCTVKNRTFQTIFLITFYVYFILLFLAATILAFLNRKISSTYSESAAVALVVYLWIGLVILYAPIYYVQGGSTDSNQVRFALRFVSTLLACSFTLIFLFYPKIARVITSK